MLLRVTVILLVLVNFIDGQAAQAQGRRRRRRTRFTPDNPPKAAMKVFPSSGSTCPGGCWMPVLADSPRTCGCVVPDCQDKDLNQDCFICQRGWGVYPTKEDCEASGPPPVEIGVMPQSYPEPAQNNVLPPDGAGIMSTSCPETIAPPGETRTGCPFYGPTLVWWQDSSLWPNGVVPTSGAVTLPANRDIIVGGCSFTTSLASFDSITIPSTTKLIFADQELVFRTGSIIVDGQLLLGGPNCRVASRITFHFRRFAGQNMFDYGIQVNGTGQIDMHGASYSPTWTFLADSAPAGATTISLRDEVPWQVGQNVVVVTTYFKDLVQNQNEIRRIEAVSADRKVLTLDQPLTYLHYGNANEYQAEVGLLSRNILLQDDLTSTTPTIGPTMRFQGPVARFSGVQTFRMGQTNTLGKYPFHWHLVGNTTEALNFIRDSTCYESRFRCVTLHGISGARVEDTVAFNIQGSAYYLEAGVEENNVLNRNLAAYVLPLRPYMTGSGQGGGTVTEGVLTDPADSAAAGFYATNMYNTFTNNAASGGFFAYSFPVLTRPLGIRYRDWTSFNPSLRPFKLFDNNVGHSSGYLWDNGGCLYTGGAAFYDSSNRLVYTTRRTSRGTKAYPGNNPSNPAQNADDFIRISNFKAYLCNQGLVHWGDRIEVTNLQTWDVTRAATYLGRSYMKGADINGASLNPSSAKGYPPANYWDLPPITGFQWYDTWTQTILSDVTFRNFQSNFNIGYFSPTVFWTITWSNFYMPTEMSFTKNLQLINVEPRALLRLDWADSGSYKMFNWVDVDGSATGRGRRTVIGSPESWWKAGNNVCEQRHYTGLLPSGAMGSRLHWVCDDNEGQNVARIEIEVPGVTNNIDGTPDQCCGRANSARDLLGWVSQLGYNTQADWRGTVLTKNTGTTGWQGLRTTDASNTTSGWFIQFANAGAATTRAAARQTNLWLTQLAPNSPLYVALRYPTGTTFTINKRYRWNNCIDRTLRATTNVQLFMGDAQGLYFFTRTTGGQLYLYLRLIDTGNPWGSLDSFVRDGVTYNGFRWKDLHYSITANIPGCTSTFCPMTVLNPGNGALPLGLPAQPTTGTCTDTAVTGVWMANCLQVGCGNCNDATVLAQNGCRSICQRC